MPPWYRFLSCLEKWLFHLQLVRQWGWGEADWLVRVVLRTGGWYEFRNMVLLQEMHVGMVAWMQMHPVRSRAIWRLQWQRVRLHEEPVLWICVQLLQVLHHQWAKGNLWVENEPIHVCHNNFLELINVDGCSFLKSAKKLEEIPAFVSCMLHKTHRRLLSLQEVNWQVVFPSHLHLHAAQHTY